MFHTCKSYFVCSIIALRKAEKEEEKRAREKIRQRLEEDKVIAKSFNMLMRK